MGRIVDSFYWHYDPLADRLDVLPGRVSCPPVALLPARGVSTLVIRVAYDSDKITHTTFVSLFAPERPRNVAYSTARSETLLTQRHLLSDFSIATARLPQIPSLAQRTYSRSEERSHYRSNDAGHTMFV